MRVLLIAALAFGAVATAQSPTVRLEPVDGKTHFYLGEPITLNLVFQNTTGQPYTINTEVYGDLSEKVEITPSTGWLQWEGISGHDYFTSTELTEKELKIPVSLDEGFIFRKPGHYEVRVSTHRVIGEMTTNAVGIDLEEMPEEMESKKVTSLVAEIEGSSRSRIRKARAFRQLAALQGDDALRAKIHFMLAEYDGMRQVTREALASTRNLKLQLELLEAAWHDPAVKPIYDMPMALSETRALMRGQTLPGWAMVARPDNSEAAKTAAAEHVQDIQVLVDTFPQRSNESRTQAAYYILLDRALPLEKKQPVLPMAYAEFARMDDVEQHMVLEVARPPARDPQMLPTIERMLEKSPADRDALPAMIAINPDGAMPYVERAFCNPAEAPQLKSLEGIPQSSLPRTDACLADLLKAPREIKGMDAFRYETRARIAARFASPAIMQQIDFSMLTPQQQLALFPLRLRYDTKRALELLDTGVVEEQNVSFALNEVYKSLKTPFPLLFQEWLRARLEHGTDAQARWAGYELSRGGDVSDQGRILKRLAEVRSKVSHSATKEQQWTDNDLVSSLVSSPLWKTSREEVTRLGEGCLSDPCRFYTR